MSRATDILRAMDKLGGAPTIQAIELMTGHSHSGIYRYLQAFLGEGCVAQVAPELPYRLTHWGRLQAGLPVVVVAQRRTACR